MPLAKMIVAARILLGAFYLLSGLTWFFGFMPALPSIHMDPDMPLKHQVVVEMIKSGWMFQLAKIAEVAIGASLVTNRFVPGMLALTAPVAFITFMLDAMILDDIWAWFVGTATTEHLLAKIYDMVIGGLCVLLLHVWLMLCYFDYYRPMLVWKAAPSALAANQAKGPGHGKLRSAFLALGCVALALGAWNFYLFAGLIRF